MEVIILWAVALSGIVVGNQCFGGCACSLLKSP